MICAECGMQTEESPCSTCGGEPILDARFRLNDVLGRRSGGATYRARDLELDRDVIVKELLLRKTQELKEVELFEREASMLERLDHPRMPKIFDHFEVGRGKSIGLYIVQQELDGESLESRLSEHRFQAREVAQLIADACELLAYLRTLDPPIVHRDIKPANLLVGDDGEVMLVDFGAARFVADTLHHAGSTVTGTFGYMAPEQLIGEAEPASDVFALGATAIRLLTGRHPGELWGDGERFDWNRDAFDAGFTAVLDRMTASNPGDRPSDLEDLADELRGWAAGDTELQRHQRALLVGSSASRPPGGVVWRGMKSELLLMLSFGLGGVAVLLFLGLIQQDLVALAAYGAVFGAVAAAALFKTLLPPLRRWHLIRFGELDRGIVTARELLGPTSKLTVKYRAHGEEVESETEIPTRMALEADVGSEVIVSYSRNDPNRCTAVPLPERASLGAER